MDDEQDVAEALILTLDEAERGWSAPLRAPRTVSESLRGIPARGAPLPLPGARQNAPTGFSESGNAILRAGDGCGPRQPVEPHSIGRLVPWSLVRDMRPLPQQNKHRAAFCRVVRTKAPCRRIDRFGHLPD